MHLTALGESLSLQPVKIWTKHMQPNTLGFKGYKVLVGFKTRKWMFLSDEDHILLIKKQAVSKA